MRNNRPKQNNLLPIILIGVGVLLILAVLIWQLTGQSVPTTTHATTNGLAPAAQATVEIPEPNIKRVSLADAKAAFDSKAALFVDVRDPASYAAGHIPGAVNIPLSDLDTRYTELDSSQWIITYCT